MTPEEYSNEYRDYCNLVDYAIAVSECFAGRQATDDRVMYGGVIYRKLVCHAMSLRKISPKFDTGGGPELWDVSSACAVARALIETFDALAYIVLNEVPPEQRRLRVLLWHVHELQRRLHVLRVTSSTHPGVANVEQLEAQKRAELEAHPLYGELSKDLKKKVCKLDAPAMVFSQRKLNEESGIRNERYFSYMLPLSQHVHTFPMATHELVTFKAGEPEATMGISFPIRFSSLFLARATTGMIDTFDIDCIGVDPEVELLTEIRQRVLER